MAADVVIAESSCASEGVVEVLIEPQLPRPLLAILGDGQAALSLGELARTIDWRVTTELTPDADAVVVATMGHADEEALESALANRAGYVGLVASARRAAVVLGRLRERGVSEDALARVRSPAGLDLGPATQPEIAVAILAELVAWRHTRGTGESVLQEAVDPVCGMTVAVGSGEAPVVYEGVSYHFCCAGCRSRFEAEPSRYVDGDGRRAPLDYLSPPSVAAVTPRRTRGAEVDRCPANPDKSVLVRWRCTRLRACHSRPARTGSAPRTARCPSAPGGSAPRRWRGTTSSSTSPPGQATLEVGEDAAVTSLVLEADGASLRVLEGTGGMQELGPGDKAGIEQTIDDEILKRGVVTFRSTAVETAADGSRLRVRGELTLAGTTAPLSFLLAVAADGSLSGSAIVTQSTWGITPYRRCSVRSRSPTRSRWRSTPVSGRGSAAPALPYERIIPRELKPALLELDGISRVSVRAHYRIYEGFVSQRNELLARLAKLDRSEHPLAELRALKIDLSLAVGGIKNHEAYFEHLGGAGGEPQGAVAELIARDFGSSEAWRSDLRAAAMAARGWAWTAYDWDERRLFNYGGDAENPAPAWNATPLVALDVDEHAYYLDYRTDRAAYIDAFFSNLDWGVVNGWLSAYEIPPA